MRKARGNVADVHDAADVFLYRDASIAPVLDMRRRFKAVMDVLDAMIRYGVSLSRSLELTAQWDRILALGPLYLVTLGEVRRFPLLSLRLSLPLFLRLCDGYGALNLTTLQRPRFCICKRLLVCHLGVRWFEFLAINALSESKT